MKTKLMQTILTVVFAGNLFAEDDSKKYFDDVLRIDSFRSLTVNGELPPQKEGVFDEESRNAAALVRSEALPFIHLNPSALAEFKALGQNEAEGSSISAVLLQELISDFESQEQNNAIPSMLSFYIARSKVEVLSPRQRVLCYVMIKSAMRQSRAKQK
ncbi:hypothetical protein ACFPK9_06825 [Rubritalea spongiae]|uniref:Uncharacterized protein n=1 Tax=Rubritalea spongiae TaxID=430797 RepID=A0ABW5E3F3_9BACT